MEPVPKEHSQAKGVYNVRNLKFLLLFGTEWSHLFLSTHVLVFSLFLQSLSCTNIPSLLCLLKVKAQYQPTRVSVYSSETSKIQTGTAWVKYQL